MLLDRGREYTATASAWFIETATQTFTTTEAEQTVELNVIPNRWLLIGAGGLTTLIIYLATRPAKPTVIVVR